jgi:hypothetical protein
MQRLNFIVQGTHLGKIRKYRYLPLRHLARDFTWLRLWFLFHGFRAV